MVLNANADVLTALREFYRGLKEDIDFDLKDYCARDINIFSNQVLDLITDMRMQAARAIVLARMTANRRNLVRSTTVIISTPLTLVGRTTSPVSSCRGNEVPC